MERWLDKLKLGKTDKTFSEAWSHVCEFSIIASVYSQVSNDDLNLLANDNQVMYG